MSYYTKHLFICTNQKTLGKTCCANTGGDVFCQYLKAQLKQSHQQGLASVRVSGSGCLGRCAEGPCIVIYPEGVWYTYSSFADLDDIIATHLVAGEIVNRLLIPEGHAKCGINSTFYL